MVASWRVTPGPAVADPLKGGKNEAQEPVHFEVVAVSGPNQYTVKPLALVSTVAPPIVVVFSVLVPEAGAAAPDVVLLGLAELPHAAIISAAAASPAGASHLLLILLILLIAHLPLI